MEAGAEAGSAARRESRPAWPFRYGDLPPVAGFDDLVRPDSYTALPDDWMVGVADVVTSTAAIEAGRYKAVNTAGAAVISAVANALGTLDFPFAFGGDGARFVVGPDQAGKAEQALAATVSWVGRELGLQLRGGAVPVGAARAAGFDVRVARFAASSSVAYAMFSGGGLAWAERQMKSGALALASTPAKARPDLTGLSCRFQDIEAANGVIVSLIVRPASHGDEARFLNVAAEILALAAAQPRAAHPVPREGLKLRWPPAGFTLEARLLRPRGWPRFAGTVKAGWRTALAHVLFSKGIEIGGFSPTRYRREMVENSDFRKFDDGLMMTLDCSRDVADKIEAKLVGARRDGMVRFGLHRQASALVTCVVPSARDPGHIHFVDGAAGGYAMAARSLKTSSG